MKKIGDLLSRFQHLESPDQKKEFLLKLIRDIIGVTLDKKHLELRGKTLFIKASSAIKNEIFLHRQELLTSFRQLKNLRIEEIR
jgi:hypothetical protein